MLWFAIALPISIAEAVLKYPLGVAPHLAERYLPLKSDSGLWSCVDESKKIPWSAVNDDYCDCSDGSDEPGTSACSNGTFYCMNKGHLGASIPSSRVDDGLCEPECCDGSDERPGLCPNVCQKVGEVYRKQQDAERKLRKTGSKIRASYIAFAQKEKKRLEVAIADSAQEIVVREQEVARLKEIADRTEALSAAALERKKESPFYASLITHSYALKSLQREHKKALERTKALEEILSSLRAGYNPNYQDMAVLEAVRGWEYHAGLPHIGVEADKLAQEEGSDGDADIDGAEEAEEEVREEGIWSKEEVEGDKLDVLLGTDYVGLLLQHDDFTLTRAHESLLFDISSYIPDSLAPKYQALKGAILSTLETFRVISPTAEGSATESTLARKTYDDAEHSLKLTREEKQRAEEEYANLFDVDGYGREGEWKKLEGTCLEKDTGEYTYEVCLFDEARQKPNKGGTTFSLGKFATWNNKSPDEIKPGDPAYYSKQYYENGAKCWNGPHRSVILVLSCGTENAIHTIQELEKCEYQFTGTTPALCLPLDDTPTGAREEL